MSSSPPIYIFVQQEANRRLLCPFSLLCLIWQQDRDYILEFGAQPIINLFRDE